MQLSQNNYEITPEEIGVRDVAELYLRVHENTQFLTNIIRHQPGKAFKVFTLDINVDIKSFFNLIVQSCYLLYTCSIRKVALFFSKNLFVATQKQNPQVIRQFVLEMQYFKYDETRKLFIDTNFYYVNPFKFENAYTQNVLQFIKQYIQIINNYTKKYKEKKNDKIINRQLQGLQNAYILLNSISQKGYKPKVLISCLQQTELFRTYSYLLKTLNCSLYQAIKKTGKFQQILCQIKRKQSNLNEGYAYMVQQNSINYEILQSSLEQFIKYLIRMGLVEMEISVNSNSNSFDSNKQKNTNKIGTSQIQKNGERTYSWKILVQQKRMREFNQKILLQLTQGDTTTIFSSQDGRKTQNLFHIEYMSKKDIISVSYISNIQVNIQNSDSLIYHCNNMTMQLNNVTVDYTQRQSNKSHKRKERVLAFKVITHLNIKQNPFINMMLLIDRAMIYGKVCEPEISRKSNKMEDYSRFGLVGRRINHLTNLFIKKIRRLYENVSVKRD